MFRLAYSHLISSASSTYLNVRRDTVLTSLPFWIKTTFISRFHPHTDIVIILKVIPLCLKYISVMKTEVLFPKAACAGIAEQCKGKLKKILSTRRPQTMIQTTFFLGKKTFLHPRNAKFVIYILDYAHHIYIFCIGCSKSFLL